MQRHNHLYYALIALIALVLSACGANTAVQAPEPTSAPKPTSVPTIVPKPTSAPKPTSVPTSAPQPTKSATANELAVANVTGYKDNYDSFHVVGLVTNGTDKAVSNVELSLSVKDASGKTLLKDSDSKPIDSLTLNPLLSTLGSGESAPFDYSISVEDSMPESYTVAVSGHLSGDVQRGTLEVQETEMSADKDGDIYIIGKLVNMGASPVHINSLAGAALDDAGAVLAAQSTSTLTRYLAPKGDPGGNDSTPFRINLPGPAPKATRWATYIDSDEVKADSGKLFNIAFSDKHNGYLDESGSFHLVGSITNKGSDALDIYLVAGLYAEDGKVLDVDTLNAPFWALGPGESVPYDFSSFSHVVHTAIPSDTIKQYSIQVDPYWTSASNYTAVALKTSNDAVEHEGGAWKFKGEVTNVSGQPLSNGRVVLALFDDQNQLVATTYTTLSPAEGKDEIAVKETVPYTAYLSLDPGIDAAKLTVKSYVQAYVKR